ncbi:hypothetical protein JR316_0000009 [Psilocybe cubensis]|uniref:Uncharacterized protein n=2 Tax=Psilocybe cubensis TaxID=181762 RepID=A0A8H8CPY6_PSICU|nr:hypothetical protein JR316_0000009 [Psilocybe cubensis]KAH9485949.1 hypothetical protein JR316_0000009 [Psilocybe cubensis]
MSGPTALVPGNYVIFSENPSGTSTTAPGTNGRSNFAVTCPLSAGGNFTITSLSSAASAQPTQIWLVTGDGMILAKTSASGQLAQSPTFYANYTNNSANIVTISAPATPAPNTKFVFHVSQVAKTDQGDALSYLATVMTADLTDSFWTVDSVQNNTIVKANVKSSAKNFVFVPV